MIAIIDYGMGNIGSLQNMLKKAGAQSIVSGKEEDLQSANKLILPGVGSFDNGILRLRNLGIINVLNKKVLIEKTPILCICLGIQLITLLSDEGNLPGLGWINAHTKRFSFSDLKIPHMGWNSVTIKKGSVLFKDMYLEPRFYFAHSYYITSKEKDEILTTTFYGKRFISSIEKDNIFATQFHPEKSHKYGLKLMKNFVEL